MGHEVMRFAAAVAVAVAVALALLPVPATAQTHGVGTDLFVSSDADDTSVVRAGANLDFTADGPDKYRGIRVEKAWFNPLGQGWRGRERAYLRAADHLGGWKYKATVGTDGDTVLGAASIHDDKPFRKELFVEREILETPLGLKRGIYYTFAGAALDLPVNERNLFTAMGGVQGFTGHNVRTHLRASYIHVLKPEWGLSAQLRTRWLRNSDPHEYDYYSPRWYAQLLPVLQVRRTSASGWRTLVAGGLGVQRDSGSGWRRSSFFNAQATTPAVADGWAGTAALLFSETPTTAGQSYRYMQLTAGLTRAF